MILQTEDKPGRPTVVRFDDPFAMLSLKLIVLLTDEDDELLDTPWPMHVVGFTLQEPHNDPFSLSPHFIAGGLGPLASAALLRAFRGRLRVDEDLRRWLRQITFEAVFGPAGAGFPEPEPDRAERSGR